MSFWLVKSEPETWSWDEHVKKGAKGDAWTGVRNHQGLHRHGVLLHDVADAGVGVDDELVGERAVALAVHGLIARKVLAERPVAVEHRHAD